MEILLIGDKNKNFMNKKNLRKIIFLLSLGFIFLGFNFVQAEGENPDITTPEIVVNEEPATPIVLTNNFIIRDGEDIIWQGEKTLPAEGTVTIDGKSVGSRSILAIIESIDAESDDFSISNLQYYTSYGGAFYLKCITKADGTELCDNWQYAVGTSSPWTSIDTTILSGNENVGIYFGTSHRVVLSDDSIYSGDLISATSEKYDYESNTWNPLQDVSIGVTLPNKDDEWSPIVVNTYQVDASGVANITIDDPNTYTVGIVEDYYIPSYQVVVSKRPSSGSSGSTPVGGVLIDENNFSLSDAVSFLSSSYGSEKFNESLYTDWLAIGISQAGSEADSFKNELSDYLKNNNLESSVVTDNERHAMALMSLDIDPFIGTNINYVKKITDSFDGTQIGDKNLINDDIFGLIVLSHAGYTKKDEIISKTISHLLSKQGSDGSWGSVDMTAASIQALNNFKKVSGVEEAISKGESYLISQQKTNGSFGNSFSTSWAIQALSLNNNFSNEVDKAVKYLGEEQQDDGGLEKDSSIESRVWATSYAIPAVSKLSWNDILGYFSAEEKNEEENSSSQTNETVIPEVEQTPSAPELVNDKKEEVVVDNEKTKIIQVDAIKKDKTPKEKTQPKFVSKDDTSDSLITASAVELNQNSKNDNIISDNSLYRVLRKLITPFVWLWNHINYLL